MTTPRARGVSRHDLERVPEPVHGFPVLATSVHNRVGNVAIIAVPDTYDARRRVRALARIDLQHEPPGSIPCGWILGVAK